MNIVYLSISESFRRNYLSLSQILLGLRNNRIWKSEFSIIKGGRGSPLKYWLWLWLDTLHGSRGFNLCWVKLCSIKNMWKVIEISKSVRKSFFAEFFNSLHWFSEFFKFLAVCVFSFTSPSVILPEVQLTSSESAVLQVKFVIFNIVW